MQKEILTIQNIKKDIHNEIKDSYIRLAVCTALFMVMLVLFLVIPNSNLLFFL